MKLYIIQIAKEDTLEKISEKMAYLQFGDFYWFNFLNTGIYIPQATIIERLQTIIRKA